MHFFFYEGDDHAFVHRLRSRSVPVNLLASGAYADDACRCKGWGCKGRSGLAGPRRHLRVEVCPRHHLRLAGRGAVQAGIGNTRLLRQAIRIGRPEASADAIGLDLLRFACLWRGRLNFRAMQDLAERGQRRSAIAPAEPILYEARIAADEAAAEPIAHALEEACGPSPVAVGVFELAKGRFEVFAHFAEAPPRETFLALIEHVANGAQFGPLRIERVPERIG